MSWENQLQNAISVMSRYSIYRTVNRTVTVAKTNHVMHTVCGITGRNDLFTKYFFLKTISRANTRNNTIV